MTANHSEQSPRFQFDEESNFRAGANIKVVGIGGGGGNAVNRMIDAGITGVEFLVANTDIQALSRSSASHKIQIGAKITKGLGAGAQPDIGRQAAIEDTNQIIECLGEADMVFITAGLGGGTGTGAAPVIASLAKEAGALVVGVVTTPFKFEGRKRRRYAEEGLRNLKGCVDTVITISNEKLRDTVAEKTPITEAFSLADDVLLNAVEGISNLINKPGFINLDFADVRTIMAEKGVAIMGCGTASGENRGIMAAQQAISSPLLEDASINGARAVLFNIVGGPDMTMDEIDEAAELIQEACDEDAEIIFGTVLDEKLTGSISITVIATDFPTRSGQLAQDGLESTSTVATFPTHMRSSASPMVDQPSSQPGEHHPHARSLEQNKPKQQHANRWRTPDKISSETVTRHQPDRLDLHAYQKQVRKLNFHSSAGSNSATPEDYEYVDVSVMPKNNGEMPNDDINVPAYLKKLREKYDNLRK
ncbi:MAG: cell division protein FtsZ [Acidobacteria bacterium]|nr:MAG: cell division protein FtsZ [Acidobacteriota bacterium]